MENNCAFKDFEVKAILDSYCIIKLSYFDTEENGMENSCHN